MAFWTPPACSSADLIFQSIFCRAHSLLLSEEVRKCKRVWVSPSPWPHLVLSTPWPLAAPTSEANSTSASEGPTMKSRKPARTCQGRCCQGLQGLSYFHMYIYICSIQLKSLAMFGLWMFQTMSGAARMPAPWSQIRKHIGLVSTTSSYEFKPASLCSLWERDSPKPPSGVIGPTWRITSATRQGFHHKASSGFTGTSAPWQSASSIGHLPTSLEDFASLQCMLLFHLVSSLFMGSQIDFISLQVGKTWKNGSRSRRADASQSSPKALSPELHEGTKLDMWSWKPELPKDPKERNCCWFQLIPTLSRLPQDFATRAAFPLQYRNGLTWRGVWYPWDPWVGVVQVVAHN